MNKPVIGVIKSRYSCRSFDGNPLDRDAEDKMRACIDGINAECKIKARFVFIANTPYCGSPSKLGTLGMVSGAVSYFAGILDENEKDFAAFGYLFEKIILFAASVDIQTCWLGSTFNRNDFIELCGLYDGEYIAAVSPAGRKKQKPRLIERAARSAIGANGRKSSGQLFFKDDLSGPVIDPGECAAALESVRLAPSSGNRQPWRIIKTPEGFHFYLKRSPRIPASRFDIQKSDMGIAMCHFELTANESGPQGEWRILPDPAVNGLEYIATWVTAGKSQ